MAKTFHLMRVRNCMGKVFVLIYFVERFATAVVVHLVGWSFFVLLLRGQVVVRNLVSYLVRLGMVHMGAVTNPIVRVLLFVLVLKIRKRVLWMPRVIDAVV